MIKALSGFTPILVDGDVEKDVCKKYGVKGYPGTVFADAKGESAGPTIVGAVPVKDFLSKAQDFAKKIKPGKPSKDYATLMAAGKALETAQAKNKIADALAAIAKIEKVNHPGKVLDDALAARKTLLEAGQMRFDAAKAAADGDGKDGDGKDGADKDGAVKELKKIATEYKGTDLGTDAAALVKELTAPPPDAK